MDWNLVDLAVSAGIERRVSPGAIYAVGNSVGVRTKAFGRLTYEDTAPSVTSETVWDLASLTKVVGTATAAMLLFESGDLHLDQPVCEVIPAFGYSGKQAITIRNLLVHDSGLPASYPKPTHFMEPEDLMRAILQLEPTYETGSATIYSDVGFIVLGKVIEVLSGLSLDRFLREKVFSPLEMLDTAFCPSSETKGLCAPTEAVEPWRAALRRHRGQLGSRWIVGEVHDPTAMVLGGVAGHAGLFSSIGDLVKFMNALTNRFLPFVRESTLRLFTSRGKSSSSRALGWDTPSEGSSAGTQLGPRSYGHTGFTGTSIWADPDIGMFAILLTNRVHPGADGLGIKDLRIAFHDAVAQTLRQE